MTSDVDDFDGDDVVREEARTVVAVEGKEDDPH